MEQGEGIETKENEHEGLNINDLGVPRFQEVGSEGLESDQKLQESGEPEENEATKFGAVPETQKMMRQEKELKKVQTQDSLQKSEEKESSQQDCMELADDEKLEQVLDENIMSKRQVQEVGIEELESDQELQKSREPVENETTNVSVVQKTQKMFHQEKELKKVQTQDSLQKSEEKESSRQECQKLVEEVLEQESDVNIIVHQNDESSFTQKQDSDHREVDAMNQECYARSETWWLESLEDGTLQPDEIPERILFHSDADSIEYDDAIHQECDGSVGNEFDRSTENGRLLHEIESTTESELVPLQTRELQDVASFPLRSRNCQHDTHLMQRQRHPHIQEQTDLPLRPFEVQILVGRNRTLGARPTTLPTGRNDYLQRVSERNISPERRALYEDIQARCVRLFYSLVISAIVVVILYVAIYFLERKHDDTADSDVTSSLPNFPTTALRPDPYVTDIETDITTPMDDLIFIPIRWLNSTLNNFQG